MKDEAINVPTQELWKRLFQASTVEKYLTDNNNACAFPSFSDYITKLCKDRNVKPAQVLKECSIERSFGHRLFSGERNPSRETVLQLAFGFAMTIDETQQLLKIAQASPLHPKVKRDAIIAYCIYNGKKLTETQQVLYDNKLPLLGGSQNG